MGLNIRKISGSSNEWSLDVRVRKAGKELRKRETFHGTKPKAEERFLELRRELKEGAAFISPHKPDTFGDVLQIYREKSPPFSVPHLCRYNQLRQHLGDVPIPALPDRLESLLKILRSNPSRLHKPLSLASLNRLMQMVNAAFNLCVRLELLDKNPITRARFPKHREVPRDRVLTEYDKMRLQNIIDAEAPHLGPIVRFALQVPCRKSELIRMRKEDLDLFNMAIRVRNGTTKNQEGIWKPVPPDMKDYFRGIPADSPYLFYRFEKGTYHPLGDFKTAWKRCLRLAGIQDFRFHDTRHVSASALLDAGTPEQVVMQVAGWRTNMLKTYYHRAGKNALGLVRFGLGSGRQVDTIEVGAAKVC